MDDFWVGKATTRGVEAQTKIEELLSVKDKLLSHDLHGKIALLR